MDKRIEIINQFYNGYDEDTRVSRSRHGQLEYLTTMKYIHQFISKKASIVEIGAGTGRYSIALAKEGHDVTAIELADSNLKLLQQNSKGLKNIKSYQGDALDLSRFQDNTFDLTLVFGPLYHLYNKQDQQKALDEAIRITKDGGVVMVAFISVHAILFDNYLQGDLRAGIEENFTQDYQVRHFTEQLFTGFNVDEFEALFENKPVKWITTVSTDSILELAEGRNDFAMSDEDFNAFAEYHLHNCEKRELLGCASHLLYICRKNTKAML
ncbi:MAG: class I SAM-dependent methyltransferase [Clostridiales bacterium]|nr:class I SAM-dependent methyltransferase [Clostridiales bacterium]